MADSAPVIMRTECAACALWVHTLALLARIVSDFQILLQTFRALGRYGSVGPRPVNNAGPHHDVPMGRNPDTVNRVNMEIRCKLNYINCVT